MRRLVVLAEDPLQVIGNFLTDRHATAHCCEFQRHREPQPPQPTALTTELLDLRSLEARPTPQDLPQ